MDRSGANPGKRGSHGEAPPCGHCGYYPEDGERPPGSPYNYPEQHQRRHSNTESRNEQRQAPPDDVTENTECCGGIMAIGGLFFAFMLLWEWILPIAGLALLMWSWSRLRGNSCHGYRPDEVTENSECRGGVLTIGGLFLAFMLLKGCILQIVGLVLLRWSWRRLRGNGYHGYRESDWRNMETFVKYQLYQWTK